MQSTPTTELDAVNDMLAAIGESPVNSLDLAGTYDLSIAKSVLARIDREVQSFGWRFNTDTTVDLAKDDAGFIYLPADMLKIVVQPDSDVDPVVRGDRLYDRKNKTFVFTKNLVATKVVYRLDYADLPETAKHYICARATRRFQDRVQGDNAQHMYTLQDEIDARSVLRKDQAEAAHLSMLDAPGVQEVLSRRARWW